MGERSRAVITIILGAGASRGVSYASGETCSGSDLGPSMPSPLDGDFFDLLQRLEALTQGSPINESMRRIVEKVEGWKGEPLWQSMEKMFYSLHVSAVLEYLLFPSATLPDLGRQLVEDFLVSIRALLNEAHGTRVCATHQLLLQALSQGDAVLTFNYDFVAERALAERFGGGNLASSPFGDWFYGLSERTENAPADIPTLYKLHGSLNWRLEEDANGETQNARKDWPGTWAEFAQELNYIPKEQEGYQIGPRWRPPVLLPYWDKRVEKGLWLRLWKGAADQLLRTEVLVIGGYSLPTTDLKARELLTLAFSKQEAKLRKVIVVDPSKESQERWRRMFLRKPFFWFPSLEKFWNYWSRKPEILHSR